MNRNTARSSFGILAIPVVKIPPLTSEKNQLLSLMSNYLKKKTDRVTTVTELITLETTLVGTRTMTNAKLQ